MPAPSAATPGSASASPVKSPLSGQSAVLWAVARTRARRPGRRGQSQRPRVNARARVQPQGLEVPPCAALIPAGQQVHKNSRGEVLALVGDIGLMLALDFGQVRRCSLAASSAIRASARSRPVSGTSA